MKFSGGEWKDLGSFCMMEVFDIADGPNVQVVEVKPNAAIGTHYHHRQTEVFYIQSGCAVLGISDQEWDACTGDIFLCQPPNRHWIENCSDDPFRMLIFKYGFEQGDTVWVE